MVCWDKVLLVLNLQVGAIKSVQGKKAQQGAEIKAAPVKRRPLFPEGNLKFCLDIYT